MASVFLELGTDRDPESRAAEVAAPVESCASQAQAGENRVLRPRPKSPILTVVVGFWIPACYYYGVM